MTQLLSVLLFVDAVAQCIALELFVDAVAQCSLLKPLSLFSSFLLTQLLSVFWEHAGDFGSALGVLVDALDV